MGDLGCGGLGILGIGGFGGFGDSGDLGVWGSRALGLLAFWSLVSFERELRRYR